MSNEKIIVRLDTGFVWEITKVDRGINTKVVRPTGVTNHVLWPGWHTPAGFLNHTANIWDATNITFEKVELYYLVDSGPTVEVEKYRSAYFNPDEFKEFQDRTEINGGGEFHWVPSSKATDNIPENDMFSHIFKNSDW